MKDPLAPKARRDGRPLYFGIPTGSSVQCFECLKNGNESYHEAREAVFNDPLNSPGEPGSVHTLCVHHLPEDAVIFDNETGLCRNKQGTETWKE